MSNSSRKHWQDDSNKYTFNQYVFYLICLGLVMAALIVWFIFRIPSERVPVTRLITITSKPGGELPAIPFQDDDADALKSVFKDVTPYFFDDVPAFDKAVGQNLKADTAEIFEKDTVVVWLSAIGDVENDLPVILGSAANQSISIDRLLAAIKEIPAQQIVIVMDCGHKLADSNKYQLDGENDYNEFYNKLQIKLSAVTQEPDNRFVFVFANGIGEQPLYSTTRRRTLFGLAFESALKTVDASDVNSLVAKINEEMLQLGGQAAQTAMALGSEPVTSFAMPKLNLAEVVEPEKKKVDNPEYFETTVKSSENWKTLDDLWAQYHRIDQAIAATSPSEYAVNQWNKLTHRMVRLSYADLQGQTLSESSSRVSAELRQFDNDSLRVAERALQGYRLIGDAENSLGDSDEIMRAYLEFHGIEFRIQHYAAVYDGLSWIMPDDATLSSFHKELDLLTARCRQYADLFSTTQPTADSLARYQQCHLQLAGLEDRVKSNLKYIAEQGISALNGLEREVAVDVLLRFPFWSAEVEDEEATVDPRALPTRARIREALVGNKPGIRKRLTLDTRTGGAQERISLYKSLTSHLGEPKPLDSDLRMLQPFAYRFPLKSMDIAAIAIRPKTMTARVVVNNKPSLTTGDGVVIERAESITGGTELDLGITIDGDVDLVTECEIRQVETWFRFANSEESKASFSDGKIKLVATKDVEPTDQLDSELLVRVLNKDTGKEYDSFSVKLRLPSSDQVDLILEVGQASTTFTHMGQPQTIRPFPNLESDCIFRLKNRWHNDRDVSILVYACMPDKQTMPGKITSVVREQTLNALNRGALKLLAASGASLSGAQSESSTVEVSWKPTEPQEGEAPLPVVDGPLPLSNGLLCIAKDAANQKEWIYWVSVFPLEEPVVKIQPNYSPDTNDLSFTITRNANAPFGDIRLKWYFSEDNVEPSFATQKTLLAGQKSEANVPVLNAVSENMSRGSFIYVDVHDWPRKYVFQYAGTTFEEPTQLNDATITLDTSGDEPGQPAKVLQEFRNPDFDRAYATGQKVATLFVNLTANLPTSTTAFSFDAADQNVPDCLMLTGSTEAIKLFYPRDIETVAMVDKASGRIRLSTKVSDYRIAIEEYGTNFEIEPSKRIGGQVTPVDGSNHVSAVFDQTNPVISEVKLVSRSSVEPQAVVQVGVKAEDAGVGFDWSKNVDIFISDVRMKKLPDVRENAEHIGNGIFQFTAPALDKVKQKQFFVGVRVTDRVGNSKDYFNGDLNFMVEEPKKMTQQEIDDKKKPLLHTLVLNLRAPSTTDFSTLTDPELESKPPLEPPTKELVGGAWKYTYSGLEAGVSYSFTGTCQIKSGFAKGKELEGESVRYTFSKDIMKPETHSKTMKFSLK